MTSITEDKLRPILDLIQKTRKKAGLVGRPFALGLATETRDGELMKIISGNRETFVKDGAVSFVWREKATRSKAIVCNEELTVSVDTP